MKTEEARDIKATIKQTKTKQNKTNKTTNKTKKKRKKKGAQFLLTATLLN